MPKITIIEKSSEIDTVLTTKFPAYSWENTFKFHSDLRIVDENGSPTHVTSAGRKFQIIGKRVRHYSFYERICRFGLGVAITLMTCGMALFNKRIKHLITKKHVSKRFAIPLETVVVIRTSQGIKTDVQIIFQDPISQEGKRTNFAKVQEGQQSHLMLVIHKALRADGGREFVESEGNFSSALLEFAKQPLNLMEAPYINAIGQFSEILEKLDEVEVAAFFNLANHSSHGTPPSLHQFNPASLLATLMFAREKKRALALSEALFAKWVQTPEVRITKLLYSIDKTVLPKDKIAGYLDTAILQNCVEQATFLRRIVKKNKVQLPPLTWRRLAIFLTDPSERLRELDADTRLEMYKLANAYGHERMVNMLEGFFKHEIALSNPKWPGLLSGYTSVIAIRQAVENLLDLLRKAGKLLSPQEFSEVDRTAFEQVSVDFGLLQGSVYLEEIVKQAGLTGIKIHSYIAVWEGSDNPRFKIVEKRVTPTTPGWRFFRQKVTHVERHFSAQEAEAITKFLVETAYSGRGLHVPHVFQITREGVVVNPYFSLFCKHQERKMKNGRTRSEPLFFSKCAEDLKRLTDFQNEEAASFVKNLSDIRHLYEEDLRENPRLKSPLEGQTGALTPFDNFALEFKM